MLEGVLRHKSTAMVSYVGAKDRILLLAHTVSVGPWPSIGSPDTPSLLGGRSLWDAFASVCRRNRICTQLSLSPRSRRWIASRRSVSTLCPCTEQSISAYLRQRWRNAQAPKGGIRSELQRSRCKRMRQHARAQRKETAVAHKSTLVRGAVLDKTRHHHLAVARRPKHKAHPVLVFCNLLRRCQNHRALRPAF